jgi:ABC-type transport system involved in cytochrome bd biosynthesis fused ATPase/permease subunit
VALPPGVLERAGTGDLLSRITTDIDRLSEAMREAVPQLAIAVVWVGLLLGALTFTSPPLALSVLVALPLLLAGCRWYFRRAPRGYRSEAAGYAAVASALTETVDAGRRSCPGCGSGSGWPGSATRCGCVPFCSR